MTLGLFESGVPYQRMLHATGGMQRYRMMRYVMVLGIILVTIFLYVSYYTTPMTVDSRYTAYVSQEQRQMSSSSASEAGEADQNFFVIAGAAERLVDIAPLVTGHNTSGGVDVKTVLVVTEGEKYGGIEDKPSSGGAVINNSGSNTGGSESPLSGSTNNRTSTASKREQPANKQPNDGVGEVTNVARHGIEIKNMKPDRETGENNGDSIEKQMDTNLTSNFSSLSPSLQN